MAGLPAAATFPIPPAANPVASIFNWTPKAAQEGVVVVTFGATNSCGFSAGECSVKITVGPKPVGGITELPEAAAAPLETAASPVAGENLFASVAGAIAAGTLALGGAAWYARRRAR